MTVYFAVALFTSSLVSNDGSVVAVSTAKTVKAKAARVAPVLQNAPGDAYFGKLHMSALRLRIRIDQLAGRYRARTESDDDLQHDARDIEDAMRIWIARYPHDVWAGPTALHIAQFYMLLQTDSARTASRAAFQYVADTFPNTTFSHQAQLRLSQGFGDLRPESPVVASPAPSSAPAAATNSPAFPGASASPAAVASPSAAAAPATAAPSPR